MPELPLSFFFLSCDHHLGVCAQGFGRDLRLLFLQRVNFFAPEKSFLSPHALTTLSRSPETARKKARTHTPPPSAPSYIRRLVDTSFLGCTFHFAWVPFPSLHPDSNKRKGTHIQNEISPAAILVFCVIQTTARTNSRPLPTITKPGFFSNAESTLASHQRVSTNPLVLEFRASHFRFIDQGFLRQVPSCI